MAKNEAYQEAERRIEAARQENATELDLRRLGLTELPESISTLTQLQTLDLSFNKLTETPEVLHSLTQLQTLRLPKNELAEISESVKSLIRLQSLDLSSNKLSKLPELIGSLACLQTLDISDIHLTEIPEAIAFLTQLKILNLSNNQLIDLPESIASLSNLKILNLSKNRFTELPEIITRLLSLESLDLNYNNISAIPNSISRLSNLKTLKIGVNQLNSISQELSNLENLEFLNLGTNQLYDLPSTLSDLDKLKTLYIDTNNFSEIPTFVSGLNSLETLWCHNNSLIDLPVEILNLKKLEILTLEGNPINFGLAAAYEQGLSAVKIYLQAKAESTVVLNEAKLILVGEGDVGKSCLLGALRGDEWVENRSNTHGIEIKTVIANAPGSNIEITLNGWDFGGQRGYRPTHQLFFSSSAIYLVVWKPREGPQQGFVKEWITLIKNREPDAKVLIVATHGGPGQCQPDIDRQELIDLFGNDTVVDFFHVDSRLGTGIAELKEAIAAVADTLPEMGRSVPSKWQRVREILQTCKKPYLPYNDVINICTEQGIDEQQAELFIQISHKMGLLTHYHHDSILRDIVILKPDWLAKAFSFVLDDKSIRRRNGLVEFDHLSQLWSHPPFTGEEGYPKELHPVFLRLMERFDLSYKVVLDPASREESTTSLIAQLVPDNRPEQLPNWGEQPEEGDRQQVQICRIVDDRGQNANAEGLFYQLIVRLHKYSLGRANYNDSVHWQRGLMLDDNYNGRALLEHIGTEVKITVRAAYPEYFLYELTKEVKWLVEHFWEGLRCEVMVPCVEPCGKKQPGTELFEVQKLIESKRQGMPKFPCMISGCNQWLDIDELMKNAPPSRQTSMEKMVVEKLDDANDKLDTLYRNIRALGIQQNQGFQKLDENDRRILSQGDEKFSYLMQMLTDEAKEGPRLFSFKPIDPGFFDRPKWISAKFQLTLWCEHARKPLPALNPAGSKQGVYELEFKREWFTKAVPYFKFLTGTLSLVLPVAASTAQFMLDDATFKGIQEELDLGQKSLEFGMKGSNIALDWGTKQDSPEFEQGEAVRAQGSMLRELHTMLKEKDPGFGGLVRVQNKRREFLWVHPQFIGEY